MSIEQLAEWLNYDPLQTAFLEALVIIMLVCLFVTLSSRLGLGSVIGYLAAGVAGGVLISLSFSDHPEELLHFAEFGVVLFLFVIGLEFSPSRLWQLRGTILGRGLAQVLTVGAVLAVPVWLYGLSWQAAVVIGLGLALSSTALVMQEIDQKGERRTDYGQTAISVLLFEDLAIVPLLLLVALLAPSAADGMGFAQMAQATGLAVGAVLLLILFGRYLLEPMLHAIAKTPAPELMTAAALGVVIGAGGLMIAVGMSPAMGAFVAGVLLAGSTYRHEIEADIEPFRGLFIGLFFMAVGLSLNLSAVAANWFLIAIAVPVLIVMKSTTIYAVSRVFGSSHLTSLRLAFGMSQHGEFGFVLFAAASSAALLDAATSSVVVTIVTLSMVISSQSDRLLAWVLSRAPEEEIDEDYSDADGDVLIIGFGRVGQVVTQPLLDAGFSVTLLDRDVQRIREAERFGTRVHYGDGSRLEVLEAAGAKEARLIVVAVDDKEAAGRIARAVRRNCPDARIILRAHDRIHAVEMAAEGFLDTERETFRAALALGARALKGLGVPDAEAADYVDRFAERDLERLQMQIERAERGEDPRAVKAIRPKRLTEENEAAE